MKNGVIGAGIAGALLVGGYALMNNSEPVRQNPLDQAYVRTDNPTETRTHVSPSVDDKDCSDFSTRSQAQAFFIANGGPSSDPHNLDRDGDGQVCESLR